MKRQHISSCTKLALGFLFTLAISSGVFAENLELVSRRPEGDYYLYPNSVRLTQHGVMAEYAIKPKGQYRDGGVEQVNVVCLMNRKRQMKSLEGVGFLTGGGVLTQERHELPGGGVWAPVGEGSGYAEVWKVVMRRAGL